MAGSGALFTNRRPEWTASVPRSGTAVMSVPPFSQGVLANVPRPATQADRHEHLADGYSSPQSPASPKGPRSQRYSAVPGPSKGDRCWSSLRRTYEFLFASPVMAERLRRHSRLTKSRHRTVAATP
jgi:hypothetical protein